MKYELDIADVARVMWVPIHDDEQVADHEVRISALEVGCTRCRSTIPYEVRRSTGDLGTRS